MSKIEAVEPTKFTGTPAAMRRRERAVDAFIDLVLEHQTPPTIEDVVARAGISKATFFRYFETLGDLRFEALRRLVERYPEHTVSDVGGGPLRDRIERLVSARLAWWEKTHPLALLQRRMVLTDAPALQMIDFTRKETLRQIRAHFATELAQRSPAWGDDVSALIATIISVESWDQFRNTFGRSPQQTRRAWVQSIEALFAGD